MRLPVWTSPKASRSRLDAAGVTKTFVTENPLFPKSEGKSALLLDQPQLLADFFHFIKSNLYLLLRVGSHQADAD